MAAGRGESTPFASVLGQPKPDNTKGQTLVRRAEQQNYSLESVDRMALILGALERAPEQTLDQIARASGLNESTALRYLLSLSSRPNLTLQIIPADKGGHAVPSGFAILRFGEADLPDVAYLEHLTSALYFDKKSDVDRYLLAMERLSVVSAKPSETPHILTTIISQLERELHEHS